MTQLVVQFTLLSSIWLVLNTRRSRSPLYTVHVYVKHRGRKQNPVIKRTEKDRRRSEIERTKSRPIGEGDNNHHCGEAPAQANWSWGIQLANSLITAVSDDSSSLDKQQVVADDRAVKPGSEKQGKVRRSRNWRVRLIWVRQIIGFNNPSVPFTHSVDFGCKGDSIRGSLVAISEESFKQPRPSNLLNIF
ncbi:hypothetical protein GOBAR_DD24082 [Gossypium barbadense]|nr:hypothetical protein GOBAR_DD24082 [Gossypium barbadense]